MKMRIYIMDRRNSSNPFTDKWPDDIEKRGYSQIPNCLIRCRSELGLNTSELSILLQLMVFDFGKNKIVWPSHKTLAKQAGLSCSAIRGNIVSLESKGFIKREFQTGTSNRYDLLPIIDKLRNHTCQHPVKKRTHPTPKSGRHPPRKSDTKEYIPRKRNNNNLEHISEIINQKHPVTRKVYNSKC